ncbi:4'-phosphopantetheinyl transferase family protein [Ferrimonas balearica]|uniref:4'-phosphopantetheinyl transferase family protein n=1 Tax=Ferrimonas balearica TaxID=44012 RepID=UPI001C5A0801|nr:hypothetical protein [Ferrimonas balearica]MBW3164034.1 hypothetical protein [Ferrimonas balearica]MBY6224016.1 hypothetical protein [Ferrimonas balearica]
MVIAQISHDLERRIGKTRQREAIFSLFAELSERYSLPSQWQKSPQGRPHFALRPEVGISLSHSAHWVALALDMTGPIGIDIEWHRPTRDIDALSQALSWPTTQFYLRWCLMEAAFKAGVGQPKTLQQQLAPMSLNCGIVASLGAGWHYLLHQPDPNCSMALVMRDPLILQQLANQLP